MAKTGGLGRGLDALIGNPAEFSGSTSVSSQANAEGIPAPAHLPEGVTMDESGGLWAQTALLKPNPHQPRMEFDARALDELADSIREHGILEPIIIEPADEGFYIIMGERRTRAAKIAGLEKVPVLLGKYDEQKKLELALIENIQRADLNPIEEALAYYNLMQMGDLSQDEVAKRVGKKRPTVANALRLLKLPDDMQKSLIDAQITAGHARALLAVNNPADQRILFGKIVGSALSVREAEALAADYNNGGRATGKKTKKASARKDPDIAEIEQKFIEVFGTKVILKGSIEKGTIQIDYFSKQDLNRLYNVIAPEK
ncbi:MAG: ParB/RepB/Spo0J family partition protein [Treponema sp.]